MNKKEGKVKNDDMDRSRKGSKNKKNTNEDVQRAIEGLMGIPDDELQEFLDDEELQGLDVVDAWEGDEDQLEQRGNKEPRQRKNSGNRSRRGRRGGFGNRNQQDLRDKRDDKKREDSRRDPSKSTKDIERDKMRTRRDNETKILAEKEKAIKNLLDSDTIVPPGTEAEAIENEMHNFDKHNNNNNNNNINREQHHRSSDRHRNHIVISPVFRRSRGSPRGRGRNTFLITPERRRRTSWDRKNSIDRRERRISTDRQFRRRIDEREFRLNRRSRSSIRSRSRDRSRRWSRSPIRGGGGGGRSSSSRRRSNSRRRSITKSPERRRKRSPFLHEIARQLNNDALLSVNINNQGFNQQIQPINIPPQNHHGNIQLPPHHYGHPDQMRPYNVPFEPPVQPIMNFEQIHPPIHQHMDYNSQQQQQQQLPPPHVLFNQMPPMIPDNQMYQTPVLLQTPNIPQPVPAPMQTDQFIQHNTQIELPQPSPDNSRRISDEHRYRDDFNETKISSRRDNKNIRHNRLVTPEPPIISEKKSYEKTSLSSLLEASVSAKGFKPEIIRNCEQALRELPDEDPRLRMKGRFFYDSKNEDDDDDDDNNTTKQQEYLSNSILLKNNKNYQIWSTNDKKIDSFKNTIETHQKYCQTEIEYNDISVQTKIEMHDFCVQVCPGDLKLSPLPREDKRPIMDRLDWNVRDNIDYVQRENDDLRWSLSSNQKRSYKRTLSPDNDIIRQNININQHNFNDINHHNIINNNNNNFNQNLERPIRDGLSPSPHDYNPHSPLHNRNDTFDSPYRTNRTNYNQHNNDRFSPNFRRNIDINHTNNYDDNISQHSRNRSPDIIDDHHSHHNHDEHDNNDVLHDGGGDDDDDIQVLDNDIFTRESNWRERGSSKTFGNSTNLSHKSRSSRGKFTPVRNFRGRGNNYRGRY